MPAGQRAPGAAASPAQPTGHRRRPERMTCSLVCTDDTGSVGCAVMSCVIDAGQVLHVAPRVGAVTVQGRFPAGDTLRAYWRSITAGLAGGVPAQQVLSRACRTDRHSHSRPAARTGVHGAGAAHTGHRLGSVLPSRQHFCGHQVGGRYVAAATLAASSDVVAAMAAAFETAAGPLAMRLLAALEAGQVEGGDVRGQQSARLLT